MRHQRTDGAEQPGWRWGPFTFRLPFYHTGVAWPEFWQGIFVAGATGLGLVPLLVGYFGLSFQEAVACIFIQSMLISSAPILFGEPFAAGWVTPALPLAIAFILAVDGEGNAVYGTPQEKFQMMTAVSLNFAAILLFMGATGLGHRFIRWLPDALKSGIILGAAIAALMRVLMDEKKELLLFQPITTTVAVSICLILTFSLPVQQLKLRWRWLAKFAGLGLLPGFVIAAIVGPMVGEISYDQVLDFFRTSLTDVMAKMVVDIQSDKSVFEMGLGAFQGVLGDVILIPPFADLYHKVSPMAIGWPSLTMFLDGFPLAIMGYVILFGDLITGAEVIQDAQPSRPDEKIVIDVNRSHFSLAIRNALMALFSPFFPTQGCLWTGVHVIVVQRWREGRQSMDSLFTGISSYYVFGVPLLYLVLPLLYGLKPLMGIALSLTLVLTGFACAYVAMGISKTPIERGVALLTAVSLVVFPNPWVGMSVGAAATLLLVGLPKRDPDTM